MSFTTAKTQRKVGIIASEALTCLCPPAPPTKVLRFPFPSGDQINLVTMTWNWLQEHVVFHPQGKDPVWLKIATFILTVRRQAPAPQQGEITSGLLSS